MVFLHAKRTAKSGTLILALLVMLTGCASIKSMVSPLTNRIGLSMPAPDGADPATPASPQALPVVQADTLEQAWSKAADECGRQFGPPAPNTCAALVQRGRTLQCLAMQFTQTGASHGYPAPEGLDAWGSCIDGIGQMLVDGYYLRAAELERRTMLCHAKLAAAPDARKPPVLTRLRKLFDFSAKAEEEKRLEPVGFGPALRGKPSDLPKCEAVMSLSEPMQAAAPAPKPAPAAASPASPAPQPAVVPAPVPAPAPGTVAEVTGGTAAKAKAASVKKAAPVTKKAPAK